MADDLATAGGGEEFDLLAASLRASATDLHTFVAVLADKLEGALPGRVRVERRRKGFLSGERTVAKIECDLGDQRYSLAAEGGAVEARRASAVRGIVLKSEPLPLNDWIDALAADLADEARTSEQSRLAVEQLLKG